jgi:hypothetical protein
MSTMKALDSLGEVINTLLGDVRAALDSAAVDGGDTARRNAVRGLFSYIEGVVWSMKDVAFREALEQNEPIDAGDAAVLLERTYSLDDQGKIQVRDNFQRPLGNLRYAFIALSDAYGVKFELAVDGRGWQNLRDSLTTRNRLMHPKGPLDLQIDNSDIDLAESALNWFNAELARLFQAIRDKLLAGILTQGPHDAPLGGA